MLQVRWICRDGLLYIVRRSSTYCLLEVKLRLAWPRKTKNIPGRDILETSFVFEEVDRLELTPYSRPY